jgi:hypothetical protein
LEDEERQLRQNRPEGPCPEDDDDDDDNDNCYSILLL